MQGKCLHRPKVRAPPHVPGKVQRSGTLSGIQRNERRAAAPYCLKTEWKRASRGIPALDPGHP